LTLRYGSRQAQYGALIVLPATPLPIGRVAVLALAGLFSLSACSVFAGTDLALTSAAPAETPLTAGPDRTAPSPAPPAPPALVARGDVASDRAGATTTTIRLKPRPKAGPYEMNLYRKGDFSHQANKDWCVAGSTQTMMNIIGADKPDHSIAAQRRLYQRGRKLSPIKSKQSPIGVDLLGWAELLNRGGYGPYVVASADTRRGAIHKAAKAIRRTDRPVGLVTWRGAHSWVMSGFTATADPAFTRAYEVKGVNIQDTWYPYVSTIWGASRPPNALVPVAALAEDYLPYARPSSRWPKRDGKFMLILPELPPNTVAR
jgi:hypothetical protein